MITPKKKLCAYHNKECFIYKSDGKDKYCKEGWYIFSGKSKEKIKPVSEKRGKETAVYLKMRAMYLEVHPNCEAKISDDCTLLSTEVHHKAGRIGGLLTNITNFLAVCRNCHSYIEAHGIESKEKGLSSDRL